MRKERRRFRRIFFAFEDGITSILAPPGLNENPFTASVMNLGEGGVGLAISRDENQSISEGDQLILIRVKGIRGLDFMINIEMEIKWVIDDKVLAHIAFGCEFLKTPQAIREKIRTFINLWDMKKQW